MRAQRTRKPLHVGEARMALLKVRSAMRHRVDERRLEDATHEALIEEAIAWNAKVDPKIFPALAREGLIVGSACAPYYLTDAGHTWLAKHPRPSREAIEAALATAAAPLPEGLTLPVLDDVGFKIGATTMELLAALTASRTFEMCFEAEDGSPVSSAEAVEKIHAKDDAWLRSTRVYWRPIHPTPVTEETITDEQLGWLAEHGDLRVATDAAGAMNNNGRPSVRALLRERSAAAWNRLRRAAP